MTATLRELQDRMDSLVRWRQLEIQRANEAIDAAHRDIAKVNAAFDRHAIKLTRLIEDANRLARLMEEVQSPPPRQRPVATFDPEWTQEDINHYLDLAGTR